MGRPRHTGLAWWAAGTTGGGRASAADNSMWSARMLSLAQVAGLVLLAAQPGGPWPQGGTLPPREPASWQAVLPASADMPSPGQPDGSPPESPPGRWTEAALFSSAAEKGAPSRGQGAAPPGPGLQQAAGGRGPTPLAPPSAEKRKSHTEGARSLAAPSALLRVAGALGLVLGLFLVVAWAMRRVAPAGPPVLPTEVLEVLGRAPLAGRQQVHLIRLGRKLVLVSVTAAGIETLSEVTDPEEVDRLAGLCRQAMPGSATAAFCEVLHQVVGKPAGRGA